jgi:hypothetical protein
MIAIKRGVGCQFNWSGEAVNTVFQVGHPAHRVEQTSYDQDLLRLTRRAKGLFFLRDRGKVTCVTARKELMMRLLLPKNGNSFQGCRASFLNSGNNPPIISSQSGRWRQCVIDTDLQRGDERCNRFRNY